jgi:hypothetical protein
MRRRDFVTHAGLAVAAVASARAASGSLLRDPWHGAEMFLLLKGIETAS